MPLPDLPLDILEGILHSLPPTPARPSPSVETLTACLQTSRLFSEAASVSTIWEQHYRLHYRHCEGRTEAARKKRLSGNWKDMYAKRRRLDKAAICLLRLIIEEPQKRKESIEGILDLGFDVWDVLHSESLGSPFDGEDVSITRPYPLTWTYWASELASAIAKQDALRAWSRLTNPPEGEGYLTFEDAMSYASSFFGVPKSKIDASLTALGDLCKEHFSTHGIPTDPHDSHFDLPSLCAEICDFMHRQGHVAATPEVFRQTLNKFPHAYLSTNKATIPLSLVHIFVSLCRQLGVEASPINFPGHVLAYVPPQWDSVSKPLVVNPSAERPFAVMNNRPDPAADPIFPFTVFPGPEDSFLKPDKNPALQMFKRSCHNILNSTISDRLAKAKDRHSALLCSYSMSLLAMDNAMVFPGILTSIDLSFPDIMALAKSLKAPLEGHPQGFRLQRDFGTFVEAERDRLSSVHNRNFGPSEPKPEYFVGMAMVHKMYGYRGLVVGWDNGCVAPERWIQDNKVDSLPKGRNQPFYHVINHNAVDSFYVAQENIIPLSVDAVVARDFISNLWKLSQHFSSVELAEEARPFGRFLQSPENKNAYPDDYDYGSQWMNGQV